ncbi:39S ribosomal protein L53, mitochondrial [Thalassophryne amazonica]|uniref:39S ribosomal protein L53, mitochondrial n=1 Tax=Thalassophryne amazonica TaxID=390379 RepID=UPI00147224C2|nr:39S ribosomal protein L53, mitochondrial [Thalassophryne amazonica]
MAAPKKAGVVLKTVMKMSICFCPFESNARSTREFLYLVGSEKVRMTNTKCEVITTVKHDRSEPVVDVMYQDGERLVMKGAYLTCKEMFSAFQSRCISKDPRVKEEANK